MFVLRLFIAMLLLECSFGGPMSGIIGAVAWAADSGTMGSVGLQVVPTSGGELVVLGVVDRSPADQGGMRPGDLILSVDDFPLQGSDFAEVVQKRLWGAVGEPVRLLYLRPGVVGRQSVTLKRAPLPEKIPVTKGVKILMPERDQEEKGRSK